MHTCIKCGKKYISLDSIKEKCACGSTVFLFNENPSQDVEQERLWLRDKIKNFETENLVCFDVENIRIVQKGVYHIDIKSLLENPLVLKDEKGVYYIKLPSQKGR